jgi:hypothetical protein
MKKFWVVLGAVALGVVMLWPRQASAIRVEGGMTSAGQYTFETTTTSSDRASIGSFGTGTLIYGFKLIADDAGDSCTLMDSATAEADDTQGIFIDDLRQDTDNREISSEWPAPYKLVTDLSIITNGTCIVYHSPL